MPAAEHLHSTQKVRLRSRDGPFRNHRARNLRLGPSQAKAPEQLAESDIPGPPLIEASRQSPTTCTLPTGCSSGPEPGVLQDHRARNIRLRSSEKKVPPDTCRS
ncbi:hypothetical protein Q9L58_010457, partial [Maublancomyces gigas]